MPQKRQSSDPEEGLDIRSLASGYSAGFIIDAHLHDWHQLVYATRGVMTVNTSTSSWVVPSHRALWVPAGTEHEIEMVGEDVELRCPFERRRVVQGVHGGADLRQLWAQRRVSPGRHGCRHGRRSFSHSARNLVIGGNSRGRNALRTCQGFTRVAENLVT